jgi:hypothetical protein
MTKWHSTKVHLNAANKKNWGIFLSKDVSKDGAKNFAMFETFDGMMFVAKKTNNVYEIVPNDTTQVYLYFDLDRPKDPSCNWSNEEVIHAFLDNLTIFLGDVYDINIQFVIGENCQVATATTPLKFSAHIKCDVIVPNIRLHKQLVENFVVFISNNTVLAGNVETFLQYETIRYVNGQERLYICTVYIHYICAVYMYCMYILHIYTVDHDLDCFYWLRVALGSNVSVGKDCYFKFGKCFACRWNQYCRMVVGWLRRYSPGRVLLHLASGNLLWNQLQNVLGISILMGFVPVEAHIVNCSLGNV